MPIQKTLSIADQRPDVAAGVLGMLARSVIETILLASLVLLAAGMAVTAAVVAMGGGHLALAAAAVAGVYTVLSCLGPRSPATPLGHGRR
jgi:hypothetical protein